MGSVLGIEPLAEPAESNAAHAGWTTTWPKCGNAAAGILHTLPVERRRSGPAPIPRSAQRGAAAGVRGAARVCYFRGHTRGLNPTNRWTFERTRGCAGLNLESQTPQPDLTTHPLVQSPPSRSPGPGRHFHTRVHPRLAGNLTNRWTSHAGLARKVHTRESPR